MKNENENNKIKEQMASIYTQIAQNVDKQTQINNITYYNQMQFGNNNFGENNIFVAKITRVEENKEKQTFEIYTNSGELIASVNEKGKIEFKPEYVEKLRTDYKQYFETLQLDNLEYNQPQDLQEQDLLLVTEELQEEAIKLQEKSENKEGKEEEQQSLENEQEINEEQQVKEIAQKKGIPSTNVLKVRENSNFYKDHPELEKNLIFTRDNNGVIKAEYIDENGELQPSKYIKESTTSLRQETVSIGDNGDPVTKQVPYQVMQTQNLNKRDEDIKDIRLNVNIDMYGYMTIEESRQGKNGKWASHNIEMQGRDYNSHQVNEETSLKTGKADPEKETKSYKVTENTEMAQDGVQYDEMYLMQHSSEIIDEFISQGYQKEEAVQIFNYMIGEDKLSEEKAKEVVNEQIQQKEQAEKEVDQQQLEDEEQQRTPWGDAEARRKI